MSYDLVMCRGISAHLFLLASVQDNLKPKFIILLGFRICWHGKGHWHNRWRWFLCGIIWKGLGAHSTKL